MLILQNFQSDFKTELKALFKILLFRYGFKLALHIADFSKP